MSTEKSQEAAEYEEELTYIVRDGTIAMPSGEENRVSAGVQRYKRGEPIEPTEHMLTHVRDKLLAVDENGYLVDHTVERGLSPEEKTAKQYREEYLTGGVSDEESASAGSVPFSFAEIEEADYTELRSMASEVSGISGNQSEEQIRQKILTAKTERGSA